MGFCLRKIFVNVNKLVQRTITSDDEDIEVR